MTATFTELPVVADLTPDGKRIAVHFQYSRDDVAAIKRVPGARFVSSEKAEDGEPYWTVPKDMLSARALRTEFGNRLKLTQRLQEWGWLVKRRESMLGSLADATDATLERLPALLPDMAAVARGYQRAGARFISEGNGALLADHAGLGKTWQVIAALAETGLLEEDGKAILVVTPATSMEATWLKELTKWQHLPAFIATGGREEREAIIEEFVDCAEFGGSAWLVVNPEMVRFRRIFDSSDCSEHEPGRGSGKDKRACHFCIEHEVREYPEFNDLVFDAIVIDESHKSVRNPRTLTARGIFDLDTSEGALKVAMTSTPITSRPIDLWGVLHWIDPVTYSSKWRWAERFCEISDNGYGKVIGGLREEAQEEFFESLKPYVLRRTKREVAPEHPSKIHVPIDLPFASDRHEQQYRQFQRDAYLKIAEMELSATGVLDELTRLRQFAIAYCDVQENPKGSDHPLIVQQTSESAKVAWLDELLEEIGILHEGQANGHDTDDKIVIFSQFARVVRMLREYYEGKGCRVGEISGRIGKDQRADIIKDFQDPTSDMRIILLTTTAGGVSIELDAANYAVFMDETWNHSDMEQAEDRLDRVNKGREVPVTIYVLRTKDTVETNVVMPKVITKKDIAEFVLDIRRGVPSSG